jgi:DNA-binding NarL/FixJ family response regulator
VVEHDLMVEAYAATALSRCQLERGRPRAAMASATEAFQVFRVYGRLLPAREPGWTAAIALAVVGDITEATKILSETNELPGAVVFDAPRRLEVEGWIAAASGDLRGARRRLHEAAEELIWLGDLQHAATAIHALARLGYADIAAERLMALASEMDGDLTRARAAHATALVAHDARGLERVAQEFETMGADLYAAEAQAAAAVDHRRAGRPRDATAAARRATVLAARCEGARTPALLGIETRAQLTRAEVETAHLAAAGHTNREIADMLFVSVRTVENRLCRIYEKLGVSGRGSLAKALRDS